MGKKSQPPPPDYQALAKEQGALNKETGMDQWKLQNTTVNTPYGERRLIPDSSQPSGYRIEETLNASDQQRLDASRGLQQGMLDLGPGALKYLGSMIGKPLDTSGMPALTSKVDTSGLQYGVDRGKMVSDVNMPGGIVSGVGATPGLISDLDMSGAPGISSGADTRNSVQQALMNRYSQFADPKQAAERAAQQNRIANMGGLTSSAAARRMMNDLGKTQADERMNAGFEAVNRGGEEATREFGMDLNRRQQAIGELTQRGQFANAAQAQAAQQLMERAGFANQAQNQTAQQLLQRAGFVNQAQEQDFGQRQGQGQFRNAAIQQNIGNAFNNASLGNSASSQWLAQQMGLRQAPLNELMALLGGTQVGPTSFTGAGGASWQPSDVYGAAKDSFAAQKDAAAAKKAQTAGIGSAIGGIGGMMVGGPMGAMAGSQLGGMISDRRLKDNIRRIGEMPSGLPVYEYTLFGQPQVGVMADEVERVFPEAVGTHPSGFKMVYYALIR